MKSYASRAMELIAKRMEPADLQDAIEYMDPGRLLLAHEGRQMLIYIFSDRSVVIMDKGFYELDVVSTDINQMH